MNLGEGGKGASRENHQFNDTNGLIAAIIQEWNKIPNPNDFVQKYVYAM